MSLSGFKYAQKERARAMRDLRKTLVHSAGCVDPKCVSHRILDDKEIWGAVISAEVRIPRSIKKRKGTK